MAPLSRRISVPGGGGDGRCSASQLQDTAALEGRDSTWVRTCPEAFDFTVHVIRALISRQGP